MVLVIVVVYYWEVRFLVCNVICTPFGELELCDMSLETGAHNRALLHISKFVMEKYLKLIYEEGSKISKYVVSFCVYPSALYLYNTSLCFMSST
jgi:hypothetical protein